MELAHTIYEPAGKGPHPTALTLHGRGANAMDLLGLAPLLCQGKFLMICPQAPLEIPIGSGASGYAWYPMSMGGHPDLHSILSARDKLESFLEECLLRYPIDRAKLVVLGFSQGGVMAYSLTLLHAERFAAMAALSSWLPKNLLESPSASPSTTEKIELPPLLIQHGSRDQLIEVARARDAAETLRNLGASITYREYDMGHEITPKSLADLSAWLEEKVLTPV